MSGYTLLTSPTERPDGLASGEAVYRAGGTDLQERLRTTGQRPHVLDLTGIRDFAGISRAGDGGLIVGAGTTIATIARELLPDYPAIAHTAAALATPQVRATATIGGNLLQRTRCWYFRHPHTSCLKSGGDSCPAREGRHLYGVVFDTSRCVHPHPSSLAMALLLHDATVTTTERDGLLIGDVLGDGSDPTRDHLIGDTEVLTSVRLPAPVDGDRAAYFRSISRFEAEWPLVEAVCRVVLDAAGTVMSCGVAIGGVAPVPLRLEAVEQLVVGTALGDDCDHRSRSGRHASGAGPLPETGYKVALIDATVREVLERVR